MEENQMPSPREHGWSPITVGAIGLGLGTIVTLPFFGYALSAVFCGGVPSGVAFFVIGAYLRSAR